MSEFRCIWTDGNNEAFQIFYVKTEEYYSKIVGGKEKRKAFIPYNLSQSIEDVLIVYDDVVAVGCAGLKSYSDDAVEIKRVWVDLSVDWSSGHFPEKLVVAMKKNISVEQEQISV